MLSHDFGYVIKSSASCLKGSHGTLAGVCVCLSVGLYCTWVCLGVYRRCIFVCKYCHPPPSALNSFFSFISCTKENNDTFLSCDAYPPWPPSQSWSLMWSRERQAGLIEAGTQWYQRKPLIDCSCWLLPTKQWCHH